MRALSGLSFFIRGSKVDRRTRARELTMQALYQLDVQGDSVFDYIDDFLVENEPDDETRKLASKWTRQTWKNIEACDEIIMDSTIKWEMSRLSLVDKSILRMSVYQMKFCEDIPPRAVINEAVEIAKKYSSDKAFSFVNGVLDAVFKKLKPGEGQ
ncbi:MAG: transcription antitermination factor NusB [Candidatus Brocadiia bacterium]|nr:MAG: transcription antitermination factor NusB [Candidatus Brocadiia bacterium]